nr:ATP synthase delta chain, chloroplastic-like [Malus domestica]
MNVSIPISVSHMNASAAASYTSPLADVVNSNNTLEAISGDVEMIEKFFDEPSVFVFFINPTIGTKVAELTIVSSVVKLESQHLAQIAKQVQKLTGVNNMRIKMEIDSSLVAGFTVRYGQSGSKLIDLSVKKQLEEIAAELDLGDIKLNL